MAVPDILHEREVREVIRDELELSGGGGSSATVPDDSEFGEGDLGTPIVGVVSNTDDYQLEDGKYYIVRLDNQYNLKVNLARVDTVVDVNVIGAGQSETKTYEIGSIIPAIVPAAYSAGDQVGDHMTLNEFGGNKRGILRVVLQDCDKQNADLTLLLFRSNVSASESGDNEPFTMTQDEVGGTYFTGYVKFSAEDYIDVGEGSLCVGEVVGGPPIANTQEGFLVTNSAATWTHSYSLIFSVTYESLS